MRFRYFPAKKNNINEMMIINQNSMPENYNNDFWEKIIAEHFSFIAKLNSEIVGYILIGHLNDNFYLLSLAINEQYRNYGIANKLIKKALDNLGKKEIYLNVRISNKIAIHLYEKYGFKIETIIPNYYYNPIEDGYKMIKK